jgi:methionine synthase II (cobalamin-independent)
MSKVIKGIQVPQRADFVGSFLRPQNLSDSTRDQLVRELTDKQKQLGYHVITDGEFNRTFWHLDFFWGFGGVTHEEGGDVVFNGETARLDRVFLTGKLKAQPHPFIDDFRRVQQFFQFRPDFRPDQRLKDEFTEFYGSVGLYAVSAQLQGRQAGR